MRSPLFLKLFLPGCTALAPSVLSEALASAQTAAQLQLVVVYLIKELCNPNTFFRLQSWTLQRVNSWFQTMHFQGWKHSCLPIPRVINHCYGTVYTEHTDKAAGIITLRTHPFTDTLSGLPVLKPQHEAVPYPWKPWLLSACFSATVFLLSRFLMGERSCHVELLCGVIWIDLKHHLHISKLTSLKDTLARHGVLSPPKARYVPKPFEAKCMPASAGQPACYSPALCWGGGAGSLIGGKWERHCFPSTFFFWNFRGFSSKVSFLNEFLWVVFVASQLKLRSVF